MQPKPHIVDLPVYQPGKPIEDVKREYGLTNVIKLASNENPYGCSPKVKAAIAATVDTMNLYPDGAAVTLTEAVANRFGVETDQIIFGAGSDDIIMMICRAFLLPGDETVMSSHTFPQYKHNVLVEGATAVEVPHKNGAHDLEGMLASVNERTKIVWVCNPNNPTGHMITRGELEPFIARVPENVLIVLDEAYAEYVEDPAFPDGMALAKKHPNVIVLRTFSKIYGLASLRIGFGIGHADVIHAINQVREPFNTNRFAQAAALAALADADFVRECRERNIAGIRQLCGKFDQMGLTYYPAYGNFIMVHTGRPAKTVFEELMKRGIIVRGGHSLGFPEAIRVTVGSEQENATFISALQDVLEAVPASG